MNLPRVIPCLLLKSEALVKTQKFQNPSYIGDPINAVRIFNELEVDELIILDIDASKKNESPNFVFLENVVSEAFMPVAIGGGISSLEHASRLINLGIEKVVINTASLESFKLIEEISSKFGSQSVVLSVDLKKNFLGALKIFKHTNGKTLNVEIDNYISGAINSGAGEIFLNFVDNEGLGVGYNFNFIEKISKNIDVPLIVSGGAGNLDDFKKAVKCGASACAAGSMFVYKGRHRAVMINYPEYKNLKILFNE
jgi:cyclase